MQIQEVIREKAAIEKKLKLKQTELGVIENSLFKLQQKCPHPKVYLKADFDYPEQTFHCTLCGGSVKR
jgi:hypothetical protein